VLLFLLNLSFDFFPLNLKKITLLMNHFVATYVDFIQSFGFVILLSIVCFVSRKLFIDNKKDNYIEAVKIKVDE
tara:strand:+ start:358 stop:579 length:222 start_codon:yes stop_codon:yes gene_type:complete